LVHFLLVAWNRCASGPRAPAVEIAISTNEQPAGAMLDGGAERRSSKTQRRLKSRLADIIGSGTARGRPAARSRFGPFAGERNMPITPYLDNEHVDPEIKRIMGIAFEMTCAALHLTDRANPVVAIVANRIIELAKSGEHAPDRLCERVLADLSKPPPRVGP
jgi:hypothetical protein